MMQSRYVTLDQPDIRLHYLEQGTGEPVLLLHGWPTSSFLWRAIIGPLAREKRVIALDLPGFGKSDKPLSASYSFRYFDRVIEGFLGKLDIEAVDLVVHDLGGPVGLYWAVQRPEKVRRLALLNTLVYPELSWAVKLFVGLTLVPGIRSLMATPRALEWGMKFGVHNKHRIVGDVLDGYLVPFRERDARRALLKAAGGLHPKGFEDIERGLAEFDMPVTMIYGTDDRILPDVARTMRRVARDVPQATCTPLEGCGHFLQEDEPERLSALLAEFLFKA